MDIARSYLFLRSVITLLRPTCVCLSISLSSILWFRFHQLQAFERLIFTVILGATITGGCDTCEKRFWTRNRSSHWWEHVVQEEFGEEEWIRNFRMSKTTFLMLCDELRPYASKKDTRLRNVSQQKDEWHCVFGD